ncbi:hypothetical protein AGDE_11516 [Angomonas deanei]|nr:hypothetical protein AGDE_11516 [Angomonas deanei]|eukprot:EPY26149.1 hypothetical protein AGDE_11516 [Angomonas deanei]
MSNFPLFSDIHGNNHFFFFFPCFTSRHSLELYRPRRVCEALYTRMHTRITSLPIIPLPSQFLFFSHLFLDPYTRNMLSVRDVDCLSEQLYTHSDPVKRQEAVTALEYVSKEINDIPIPTRQVVDPNVVNTGSANPDAVEIVVDIENVPIQQSAQYNLVHSILRQSENHYTMFFISQALITFYKANEKLLSKSALESLIGESYGELCLKRLLFNNAPKSVLATMIFGYARLTKLTFAKEPFIDSSVYFALNMFTNSGGDDRLRFLGSELLTALVTEHSKFDSSKNYTFMNFATHRRCSNNFRDECLLDIFRSSVTALAGIPSSYNNNNNNSGNAPYTEEIVGLVRSVLTYDFMAVIANETDEQSTSQFPSTWKETLLSDYTLEVLWGQHKALPYPHCATLMEGLAGLCGIRRTFFEDVEARLQYLDRTLYLFCDSVNVGGDADRAGIPHYVMLCADAATRFVAPFGYRDLHVCKTFEKVYFPPPSAESSVLFHSFWPGG